MIGPALSYCGCRRPCGRAVFEVGGERLGQRQDAHGDVPREGRVRVYAVSSWMERAAPALSRRIRGQRRIHGPSHGLTERGRGEGVC